MDDKQISRPHAAGTTGAGARPPNPFKRESLADRARAQIDAALALRGPFKWPPSEAAAQGDAAGAVAPAAADAAALSEQEAWESVGRPDDEGEAGFAGAPFDGAQGERFGGERLEGNHPEADSDSDTDLGAILVSGDDLHPEPVHWLWKGWLALGKLHILAGAPGQGKTTIAMALAATVTRGGRWPDGTHAEPGNILVWSGEDDPADTLLPRLLAAGAERSRCYFVQGTRVAGGQVLPFDPATDLPTLARKARRIGGVRLLVVDPVVSAVAGDSHKNTEVRRALQPLVDLAGQLGAAVLGISHFSKGGAGGDPLARVSGSVAFGAMPRVVLLAAKVPGVCGVAGAAADAARRIVARAKNNLGKDTGGFEYHIDQLLVAPGIEASCILWGDPVNGTARELLAEPEELREGDGSALDAARHFLRRELADGQMPAKLLQEEAAEAGLSWGSVRRAAEDLMVFRHKGGAASKGAWYWKLPSRGSAAGGETEDEPEDGHQGAQDA